MTAWKKVGETACYSLHKQSFNYVINQWSKHFDDAATIQPTIMLGTVGDINLYKIPKEA